ncbi:FtsB family cell division protein [Tenacibaculum maritimum]|uniref:Probable septum formation initiator n=1 Tax=Tenacibaculum maritimum NCIMB 2154 TaxID=1349785 RepID=A0A2H1E7Y8_9FLAO|nr:septum formation initiator family protein [Tenacibaculum maritimum]MCD9562926.1 septum formation initiator family protein [Tenacibaculum maritimum]MCD9566385.1 septum formation initiator family protein [Tenacibaculum maritimum]MCD9579713.1 septum formation initiator family protein [Tenacibaculum maritimum]MCD9585139.1 septum formation initiator family protein [Tenacibaculum maritimum]MCD9597946.1 septum formation initiator family protein [Tenacibaculum maritimum]
MTLKQLKNNPFFKIITNSYVLILTIFIVWMLFFDENSYLVHREFNQEIEELKSRNEFYKNKIIEDKKTIQSLEDSIQLEQYAREKYLMKKENEDIYIIEFDTIKK